MTNLVAINIHSAEIISTLNITHWKEPELFEVWGALLGLGGKIFEMGQNQLFH